VGISGMALLDCCADARIDARSRKRHEEKRKLNR